MCIRDRHRYQFFTADFYARLICFVCFVFFPTTNTRPELTGSDIFTGAVRFLYQIDKPINLFPSIHCMASWFCCIGLRKCENVPKWYQNLSEIIAVLVFISTLALRQHVLDVYKRQHLHRQLQRRARWRHYPLRILYA